MILFSKDLLGIAEVRDIYSATCYYKNLLLKWQANKLCIVISLCVTGIVVYYYRIHNPVKIQ